MTRRGSGRTVPCHGAYATKRFAKAEAFSFTAELDPLPKEGAQRSVAVSNAALAGIAAADAICCASLGERSADDDHNAAVALLGRTPGKGQDAGYHLRILLSLKYKAQYDDRNPTMSETKRALRSMRALLRIAESFI